MPDDSSAPPPEAEKHQPLEFDSEAWIGEPDNRPQSEFVEMRGKFAFVAIFVLISGVILGIYNVVLLRLWELSFRYLSFYYGVLFHS